jgi:hypothetical protein
MKVLDLSLILLVLCEIQRDIDVSGYRRALILVSYLRKKLIEVSKGVPFQKYVPELIDVRECRFFYGVFSQGYLKGR